MHEDHERRGIGSFPGSDIIAVIEMRALVDLPLLGAPAQVAVDWEALATQLAGFTPAPAGSLAILRPMIPAAQDWNRHRFPERCEVSLDRLLDLVGELMPRDEDRDLRPDAATSDVVQEQIKDAVLCSLLRLVVRRPLHRLSRLPEARRALHQQLPDRLSVLASQPPEEKPLNDLAQPLLGFLRREEGGAAGWW